MFLIFILFFLVFVCSLLITEFFINFAFQKRILDFPLSAPDRKSQKKAIPLLGGTGLSLVCTLTCLGLYYLPLVFPFRTLKILNIWLNWQENLNKYFDFNLFWITVGIFCLLFVGYLDDRYQSKPLVHLLRILLILLIPIFMGELSLLKFSYPLDQIFTFSKNQFLNFWLGKSLAYFWLLNCTFATKFLDGHDGLVTSVSILSFLAIASVCLLTNVNQPLLALFCLIWVTGLSSFLFYNFPNARVYLGEGASLVTGYSIGVFSIIAGAKVATAGMVIGWFILDFFLVIITRIIIGQKPWQGDNKLHWHHRLKALGLTKIQVLVLTIVLLLITTHLGLIFGTIYKASLLILQVLFLTIVFCLSFWFKNLKSNLKVKIF